MKCKHGKQRLAPCSWAMKTEVTRMYRLEENPFQGNVLAAFWCTLIVTSLAAPYPHTVSSWPSNPIVLQGKQTM
jgi:hypothetical protein